jgi:O-methyltransferase involved in polyketide biosynthesis
MSFTSKISETAFIVNASRAKRVEVSQDIYAQLWVSDAVRELWDDFAREVYPHDDLVLAIRNRYFLDRLNAFVDSSESPVFINIGSGFTSYPFLIRQFCRSIEVDYEPIIRFKRGKVTKWQQEGILPKRDVNYFAADLNQPSDRDRLKERLTGWMGNHPSFILLEGITYYLDKSILTGLLKTFSALQVPGSMVSFDFWKPDIHTYPVFVRLRKYLAGKFGYEATNYNLLDYDFIQSIQEYYVVELTSVDKQEKLYSRATILQDREQVLPENYVVLKVDPRRATKNP